MCIGKELGNLRHCNMTDVICYYLGSSEQEGTRLKADYELTWDKVGFFQNSRRASDHRDDGYRNETAGYNTDDLRRKRFRVCMLYDHIFL